MSASAATMLSELLEVRAAEKDGWWTVQEVDEIGPSFTVRMTSRPTPKTPDGDAYLWRVTCDNYRAQPPVFDTIDLQTGALNTKRSAPARAGDSFFNEHNGVPVICHQFNRRAYGPNRIHADWTDTGAWEKAAGDLVTLVAMLSAIHARLHSDAYVGPIEVRN